MEKDRKLSEAKLQYKKVCTLNYQILTKLYFIFINNFFIVYIIRLARTLQAVHASNELVQYK